MKVFRIWITVFLFINFFSCKKSFLKFPAQGSLSEKSLENQAGIEGLLTGAYAALNGVMPGKNAWQSAPDNWIYGSIAGGDSHKGSFGGDQPAINPIETWDVNPSNGFLNDRWISLYDGIGRANSVIETV